MNMDPEFAQVLCEFPQRLHPVSQMFLDTYIDGRMGIEDFLRFFSLPNSDYVPLGDCFVYLMINGIGV